MISFSSFCSTPFGICNYFGRIKFTALPNMAQPSKNEGAANEPLLVTLTGVQIWRPVFSPATITAAQRLDILYDIQTKTYFQFDISTSTLKQIYTLSPQNITQKDADTLFKNGHVPLSLHPGNTTIKAFLERFDLDATKVLSSLLIYHAACDSIRVSLRRGPSTLSLHEYYETAISKKKQLPGYLNLLRPATDLAHRCTTVVLCADGIFFCGSCASFFCVHTNRKSSPFTQSEYLTGQNYFRIPVGKSILSKFTTEMVKTMLLEGGTKNVSKSAYQHLGGIFKINFGITLSTVPVHVLLALVLSCCLFVDKKGDVQSAEDAWGPIVYNEDIMLAKCRADLKVGVVDDMVMKKTMERDHLHLGGIQCFLKVSSAQQ